MSFESLNVRLGKKKNPILQKIQSGMKERPDLARARASELQGKPGLPVKIPEALKSLLDSITDDDIENVAVVWREALGATTMTYDLATKSWIERPDYNTRLKAGQLIAAYREGMPIARQVTMKGKFKDLSELLAKAQASPETMKALGGVIDIKATVQETGTEKEGESPSVEPPENTAS